MIHYDKLPIASIGMTFLDWPSKCDHAIVVYFEGCNHCCDGCQSPDLTKIHENHFIDVHELAAAVTAEAKCGRTNKVVFSGGDPLFSPLRSLQFLIDALVESGHEICIYSGHEYDTVFNAISGFRFAKVGKYVRKLSQTSQKTDTEFILASSNQAIWDNMGNCLTKDGILAF